MCLLLALWQDSKILVQVLGQDSTFLYPFALTLVCLPSSGSSAQQVQYLLRVVRVGVYAPVSLSSESSSE